MVLVGHAFHADIKFLRHVGVTLPPDLDHFDTSALYAATRPIDQDDVSKGGAAEEGGFHGGIGLGRLCEAMGIDTKDLHNAGT